jgi:hypothetical protein
MKAPRRGFANSQAISTIVSRTLKRAGIHCPHTGAHLFRHYVESGIMGRKTVKTPFVGCTF